MPQLWEFEWEDLGCEIGKWCFHIGTPQGHRIHCSEGYLRYQRSFSWVSRGLTCREEVVSVSIHRTANVIARKSRAATLLCISFAKRVTRWGFTLIAEGTGQEWHGQPRQNHSKHQGSSPPEVSSKDDFCLIFKAKVCILPKVMSEMEY